MKSVGSFVACGGLLMILASAGEAMAVQFHGIQTAAGEWTYTLTYDPWDNYSVCQASTTITLSGLVGVTQALAPTSTDFPIPQGSTDNLRWTAQVSPGGTMVTWTHTGGGTGNWSVQRYVYGFKVLAPHASTGTVTVSTKGFARDGNCPTLVLDFASSTAGPVAMRRWPRPNLAVSRPPR